MSKKEKNVEVEATVEAAPRTAHKVTGVTKDAALTVLVEANPKRASSASYARFEGYLTNPAPATVEEALKNGLTMGDIKFDIIHGFIAVEGAVVEEYEVKPRGPRSEKVDAAEESDLLTEANEESF